jgi:hypothetical protein
MLRILALALAAALAFCPRADSWLIQGSGVVDTGKQLFLSNTQAAVSGASDAYIGFGVTGNASATPVNAMTVPIAGAIKSIKFTESVQPAAGTTWTATVYVNRSPTAAAATVTSTSAIGDWIGSVAISAGDELHILLHPSGGPATSLPSVTVGFTPTTPNETIIPAGAGIANFATAGTSFLSGYSRDQIGANSAARQLAILPDGGTIDLMYIASVAPGVGKSYAYTLDKNGSTTAVTATISGAATSANDVTHAATFAAGDYLQFQAVPSGTPTASDAGFGARFVPTTSGSYIFVSSQGSSQLSASAVRYLHLTGGAPNSTEATAQAISRSQTFTAMRAKVSVAPGSAASGKKWTVELMVNGIGSGLKCDILETATTGSASGTVAVNDNDRIDWAWTPTNTPAGAFGGASTLAHR